MFTRPGDLTDADIGAALLAGWDIAADQVEYAAVGFGSHHWRVTAPGEEWFLSLDDLDARRRDDGEPRERTAARLRAALTTARTLRDTGRTFVIAPVPTRSGSIVRAIGARYVLAVYPHIDGVTRSFGDAVPRPVRLALLDRLVDVHGATEAVAGIAERDDLAIPRRDELERTLASPANRWGPGPYAGVAQALLARHTGPLRDVLARADELADRVRRCPDRFVITHGEPHWGNTIDTSDGIALIDWDTALLAPPERDLWTLLDADSRIADDYEERTGRAVDPDAVLMYRLWWDLCEIALYVAEFRVPHHDSADARTAWAGLQQHLDPKRWAG